MPSNICFADAWTRLVQGKNFLQKFFCFTEMRMLLVASGSDQIAVPKSLTSQSTNFNSSIQTTETRISQHQTTVRDKPGQAVDEYTLIASALPIPKLLPKTRTASSLLVFSLTVQFFRESPLRDESKPPIFPKLQQKLQLKKAFTLVGPVDAIAIIGILIS